MTLHHGFELIQETAIDELSSTARLYRHAKTGARLLSMVNQDENKVFGITFRTPPTDSTGVSHILEHSVLCGSRKYPVKEPFVELLKGSLYTFLNAFTFPDKTCYPVASQNEKDFHNLIDVYLDAVFFPRLTPPIFQQEAWHYELEQADAPLTCKGVVYNEMKGAYSNPDSVLGEKTQQSVFPDITYGVDSGGDPKHIPDLTYEQLKQFHANYYHPSNSYIFFYGDDDPDARLRKLDEVLSEFDAIQPESSVGLQPRFDAPRQLTEYYAANEEEDASATAQVTVNWLLPETLDAQVNLSAKALAHILIGTAAAPLRKALIDSGLGEDLTGAGLESDLRQMYFSTGLKGIQPGDADKVEQLILDTLAQLAKDGIDPETIEASMNTIEFTLRENNTGGFPRGLAVMVRALTTWLYDGDPLSTLAFEAPLQRMKQAVAQGEPYFENLIREYLLDNAHRTRVLLLPDPALEQKREQEEIAHLAAVRAGMTDKDLQQLVQETADLREMQVAPDRPDALATIPHLMLDDLDRAVRTIPIERDEHNQATLLTHDVFTNGIVYLDLGFDMRVLPPDLLPYMPLFGASLLQIGTQTQDFVKLGQRIGQKTGGIGPSIFTSLVHDAPEYAARFFLRGKAMMDKSRDLFDILRDILLTVKLDNRERFRQLLLEERADLESSLAPAGHGVVDGRLRARFNQADWAAEQMGGVSNLFFLRKLTKAVDQDWPEVLAKLETVRELLIRRNGLVCNVTLDADNLRDLQPLLRDFIDALPDRDAPRHDWTPDRPQGFEGLSMPAQVNYVGKGANLYDLGYHYSGSVAVILKYLRTTYMWERVRVQGGAYGGFCRFDKLSGVFTYLSYRDPNLLVTLDNYDAAADFLLEVDLSQAELEHAVIGAIGEMDAYKLPDAKGYSSMVRHLVGETDEQRQQRRDEALATKVEDFRAFGEVLAKVKEKGEVVVLGGVEAIRKANEQRPGLLNVVKVL